MRSGREIDPKVMSFLGHLEELRQVFFSIAIAVLVSTVLCWFFSGHILDWIVTHTIGHAQFLRPAEAFSTRFRLALFFGFLLSFPYLAVRVWSFIGPGLFRSERAVVLPAALSSTVLFVAGMAFSYFVLTPMMLRLLVGFGTAHVSANIAVGFLMGFILKMALATGLLFQLPLAVAALTRFGFVTPGTLWKRWRHAVLIIFVVAAVVTPGDGPSQIVLAAPIIVLYFASIWVSSMIMRGQRREEREAAGRTPAGPKGDA